MPLPSEEITIDKDSGICYNECRLKRREAAVMKGFVNADLQNAEYPGSVWFEERLLAEKTNPVQEHMKRK